jgi:hypothetical protein
VEPEKAKTLAEDLGRSVRWGANPGGEGANTARDAMTRVLTLIPEPEEQLVTQAESDGATAYLLADNWLFVVTVAPGVTDIRLAIRINARAVGYSRAMVSLERDSGDDQWDAVHRWSFRFADGFDDIKLIGKIDGPSVDKTEQFARRLAGQVGWPAQHDA